MACQCNICGSSSLSSLNGRENAFCMNCGSYERTRILKLFIDEFGINDSHRVLHIGPERGLSKYIRGKTNNYLAADFDVERYSHIPNIIELDLCDFKAYKKLGLFDLIIHSHVIEHVRCNYTAVLVGLHKLLSKSGRQLFSIPIYGKGFEEDLSVEIGPEALSRFGQEDHVRRFSVYDLQATIGAVFNIPRQYNLAERFPGIEPTSIGVPDFAWHEYTGHSVFCLAPDDLLL